MNEFPINKYNIFFFKRIALRRAAAPRCTVRLHRSAVFNTDKHALVETTNVCVKKKKNARAYQSNTICV